MIVEHELNNKAVAVVSYLVDTGAITTADCDIGDNGMGRIIFADGPNGCFEVMYDFAHLGRSYATAIERPAGI